MADAPLSDALLALKNKINALAETASAEDLAMLGVAMEKIAGRVTAVEIQIIGDELKAALTTFVNAKTTEIQAASAASVQTLADRLAVLLDDANTAEILFTENAEAKTATFNTNATNKTKAYDDNAAAKTAALKTVYADQFTTMTVAADSTVNAQGFFTSIKDGRGRVYSAMTYDSINRLKTWTESVPLPDGTTAVFNYTATYTGDSVTPTITRVAA